GPVKPRTPRVPRSGRPTLSRDSASSVGTTNFISRVVERTNVEIRARERSRAAEGKRPWKKQHRQLAYATAFALMFSAEIAAGLKGDFAEVQSGEVPSQSRSGLKRLDVSFGTREAGLGFGISLKSVHFGEKKGGASHFTHNMKRNDEELR